jgi:hydroxyacylglutathione hydrolase
MLNIFRYTGGIAMTNGYIIENPGGGVAVDAPEGFADWLGQRGGKVSALLLTHQHFDHVMDAARIQRAFGAPIYAFAPFSRALTLEDLMRMASGVAVNVEKFVVDHVLRGEQAVTVGGTNWQISHIPGHSPDSITFYNKSEKLLLGGDVLFMGSVGRTDFPGGDGELLIRGIQEKLMVLPDDTRVLPGHGEETTIGLERAENPYL